MCRRAVRGHTADGVSSLRGVWGALLLVEPGLVLRVLPHPRIDRGTLVFARVLGARDLIQAVIVGRHRSRDWILASVAVDGTHAATMALFAAVDRDRRLALCNVVIATTFAVAGVQQARVA